MTLLRCCCYFVVLCAITACGGGGSGKRASATDDATNPNVSINALGGFPAFTQPPAGNQSMLSCQTNAPAAAGSITGTISYQRVPIGSGGLDYNNIQDLPARGVVVQAVDAPAGSCTTTVVATALTNSNGQYGLDVQADRPVCVEARAQLYRDGSGGGASWDVQVVDNTNSRAAYYLVDSTPASATDAPVRNLLAGAGVTPGFSQYTAPRAAASFAILDSICEAIDLVVAADPAVQLPQLAINWSENNTSAQGNFEEGDIGGAFFRQTLYVDGDGNTVATEQDVFLLGDANSNTDEYDPHVINHEFGHFLTFAVSRVDAIGGEHSLGDRLDPRVAYDEGFADAFASMTLDGVNPVVATGRIYRDSLGNNQELTFNFAIDRNDYVSTGWYSESSVYSTVYNAYDSVDGIYDNLSLGFAPLYSVLTSNTFKNSDSLLTLFTFVDELKRQRGEDLEIDLLLSAENIESVSDAFGSGESVANNDAAGAPDVDSPYWMLSEGVSRQICSNNYFGEFNKLVNAQYARFSPAAADTYTISVAPVSNGRPKIEIFRQGELLKSAQAAARGQSIAVDQVLTGEAVIVISDYDNSSSDGVAPGRYCFDVLVN